MTEHEGRSDTPLETPEQAEARKRRGEWMPGEWATERLAGVPAAGDTGAPAGPLEPSEAAIDAAEAWYYGDQRPPERLVMRPFIRGMARAILAAQAPRPPERDVLTAARALLAEGPFHTIPPTLGALERLADAVAKSGAPRPEPLRPEPCAMNARCERCTRLIYGSVPDSTCAPFADCALKAYRAALRGAPALPTQWVSCGETDCSGQPHRWHAGREWHDCPGVPASAGGKDGSNIGGARVAAADQTGDGVAASDAHLNLAPARSSLPSGPPEGAKP